MDEELHSLQLKDIKLVDKVGFTKEEGKEVEVLEPIVPMRISPDIDGSSRKQKPPRLQLNSFYH